VYPTIESAVIELLKSSSDEIRKRSLMFSSGPRTPLGVAIEGLADAYAIKDILSSKSGSSYGPPGDYRAYVIGGGDACDITSWYSSVRDAVTLSSKHNAEFGFPQEAIKKSRSEQGLKSLTSAQWKDARRDYEERAAGVAAEHLSSEEISFLSSLERIVEFRTRYPEEIGVHEEEHEEAKRMLIPTYRMLLKDLVAHALYNFEDPELVVTLIGSKLQEFKDYEKRDIDVVYSSKYEARREYVSKREAAHGALTMIREKLRFSREKKYSLLHAYEDALEYVRTVEPKKSLGLRGRDAFFPAMRTMKDAFITELSTRE